MLVLLAAFALVPLIVPPLVRRLGSNAFLLAAVLPLVAFAYTAAQTPAILAGAVRFEQVEWIPSLGIALSMRMDTLSWLLALIVTGVGALVMIYCRWYFAGKTDGLGQFASVLLAFAGAMFGLVLTDDLVVLVMFWEITSVLSYLLIGYYHARGASRRAALQALLVTSLGGLVMLIGVVLLVTEAGTTSISTMLAEAPTGPVVNAALVLLLVGALSKSAIFPFHFWLPGAMAAPTPVSAYLHAAAMVKAGIYLIARFAPVYAMAEPWRPIVISLGVFTMLLGGVQALREVDLKRILAFGTVSQLGFLTVVLGFGTREAALAGLALLLSHALFKSSLFLVVGIIDHQVSTRDITDLTGLGRQAPALAAFSMLAVASMAGIIPTIGFVAKEGVLAALLDDGGAWAWVALIGIALGSALTVAYGIRFVWGAFWTKKDADGTPLPPMEWPRPGTGFVAVPVVLSALTLVSGIAVPWLDTAFAGYADLIPAHGGHTAHLALWHGWEPALWISLGTIVGGAAIFWLALRVRWSQRRRMMPFTAVDAYNLTIRGVLRAAVATTSFTQRGSLPLYVGTIFIVFVAAQGTALVAGRDWQVELEAWQSPVQVLIAPVMIIAGLLAVRARKRYTGVVLV